MSRVQHFDFSVDLLQALLWQHNDATRLQTLLEQKQAWYDQTFTNFWQSWVTDVFDLRTANDFGLSVWARILGVPLVASVTGTGDRPVFGFGVYNLNFNNGNFGRDSDNVLTLTTEQKRLILRLRYFQLVSDGTVPDANRIMAYIFGEQGGAHVLDGLDMTCTYVFEFAVSSRVLFVLERFDLLPRPAGVAINILINPRDRFGFDPYYLNFVNSNFGGS